MRYIIHGGVALKGEVRVSGSKNAALPILAATLLTDQVITLSNVPDVQDVHMMLRLLKHVGAEYTFSGGSVRIQTKEIQRYSIPYDLCNKIRASLLLVGPLLSREGRADIGYPGGCVLGKRPIDTHLDAFREMGVGIAEEEESISFQGRHMAPAKIILKEISVTGTENVVMAAALLDGVTEIRLAATEPHVQDLCRFLKVLGVPIEGIGTHTLRIHGQKKLEGGDYRITSDYLEVGSLAIAAAATRGDIVIQDAYRHDLDALWQKLLESGVELDFGPDWIHVDGDFDLKPIRKLDTGIFPKFPTDLQAPFMVLMTRAAGVSKVFETLFEGRLNYLFELEQMGATIEVLNPHQALVVGPVELKGVTVASCDIRAGAAMIVAGLMAQGITEVTNVNYIDRGYELLDEKLRSLGANIVRVQSEDEVEQRAIRGSYEEPKPVLGTRVKR